MTENISQINKPIRPAPELLSIVVPVYNEADNVEKLVSDVSAVLAGQNFELVFVDDGSTDETFAVIERISRAELRVRGISLARNFGHQNAIAAGLSYARGQAVVTMDGDLQHPPELLGELVAKWREGFNVVQTQRLDGGQLPAAKRLTSACFYKLFSWASGVKIDPGLADFRLLDRSVVQQLTSMREGRLFLRGLLSWMGYRQAIVPYEPSRRFAGRPKYTLPKMLHLARSGMISFSTLPVRIGTAVGLASVAAGFIVLLVSLGRYLAASPSAVGALAGTGLVMFGVLCCLLGIQGGYLIRIFERVQNRPTFVIERVTGSATSDAGVSSGQGQPTD